MSVSAMISNPKNKAEELFNIPVASEKFFGDCWMPAIRTLGLSWVACFQSGVEITKDDFQAVLTELKKIKPWASENLNDKDAIIMIERIENLIDYLKEIFKDDDNVIAYIG